MDISKNTLLWAVFALNDIVPAERADSNVTRRHTTAIAGNEGQCQRVIIILAHLSQTTKHNVCLHALP